MSSREQVEAQKEIQREQARQQRQQQVSQAAVQQASQSHLDPEAMQTSEFIESFTDPDISRDGGDDADLDEFLAAEFDKHLSLANLSSDEYEKQKLLDRSRALLARCEFRRSGVGGKCDDHTRKMMGYDEGLPKLDGDRARQIDAAFEARSRMRSLSKGARALRALTEIQAVSRTEQPDQQDDSSLLSKATLGLVD